MTYDAGSANATATISLNGTYKASIDVGDDPIVETNTTAEIVYTPTASTFVRISDKSTSNTNASSPNIPKISTTPTDANYFPHEDNIQGNLLSNGDYAYIEKLGEKAMKAYDDTVNVAHGASDATKDCFMGYKFTSSKNISKFKFTQQSNASQIAFQEVEIYYYDGSSWIYVKSAYSQISGVFPLGEIVETECDINTQYVKFIFKAHPNNDGSHQNYAGVDEIEMFTVHKSTVTGATLSFDGFDQLTLTATGTNIDSGFGYLVERSADNSTWTPVAGGAAW